MNKQTEALKLALEALELAQDNLRDHGDNCFLHDEGEYNRCFCGKDSLSNHLQSVVEKLDEALAHAPTEREQPAQQEPVLWLVNGVIQASDIPKDYTGCLFTSPPAAPASQEEIQRLSALVRAQQITIEKLESQRQWVGLTDKEYQELHLQMGTVYFYQDYARALEAKLRERNEHREKNA